MFVTVAVNDSPGAPLARSRATLTPRPLTLSVPPIVLAAAELVEVAETVNGTLPAAVPILVQACGPIARGVRAQARRISWRTEMMKGILRRIVCAGALLALSVATSPGMNPAATIATPATAANVPGEGWGSALACAACLVGAGLVVVGGPGSILIAVNTPGSAVAAAACVSACYDTFK